MFCVIQSFIEDVPVYKCIVASSKNVCEMVELADGVIRAIADQRKIWKNTPLRLNTSFHPTFLHLSTILV